MLLTYVNKGGVMARPRKCRRILMEPEYCCFTPDGEASGDDIFLTVDEYETIRLIDFENSTQAECAEKMGVARTTVTQMYDRARFKVAECLVTGKRLHISGGDYEVISEKDSTICKTGMKSQEYNITEGLNRKGENQMRVAVTYDNGNVFQHFGHTENFKVYTIEDGKCISSEVVSTNGQGHGALAAALQNLEVETIICGGIGGGAINALSDAGIEVYAGNKGETDAVLQLYLEGNLIQNTQANCNHHSHEEGHSCGEQGHSHGENHSCGKQGHSHGENHGCKGHGHSHREGHGCGSQGHSHGSRSSEGKCPHRKNK